MRDITDIEDELTTFDVVERTVEFYNSPAFLEAEESNPALLETYAEYVVNYAHDEDYLTRARKIIPQVCEFLHSELLLDGKIGACLDFVQPAMKIFEQLDIWCMAMAGSLTVEFDEETQQPRRFWAHVFEAPEGHNAAGHAWLVAPPFKLIDMTIGLQHNTDSVKQLLPEYVLSETTEYVAGVAIEDLLDRDYELKMRQQGYRVPDIHELMKAKPEYARMMRKFRPFSVHANRATLKYFPCAVGALQETFDATTTHCFRGQTAPQLLERLQNEVLDQD